MARRVGDTDRRPERHGDNQLLESGQGNGRDDGCLGKDVTEGAHVVLAGHEQ